MSLGAGNWDGLADLRLVRVTLAPDLAATATARQVVERACRAWHLDHVLDTAQLVITELVSNVVRHARTEMEISLTAGHGALRLAVHDGDPSPPAVPKPGDNMAETGRGLLVIQALTTGWGTMSNEDGKVVWAVLATDL
jgi:anti-sigma regulatory factor (Ser/Thr protein kinase)